MPRSVPSSREGDSTLRASSAFPEDALEHDNNPSGVVGSSSAASSNAGWVDVDAILGEMCGPVPLSSSSSSSSGDHRGASDDSHMMTATAAAGENIAATTTSHTSSASNIQELVECRILTYCMPASVARYLYGWTLEGMNTNLRKTLILLGWVWLMGAQCATIRQFTEDAYDDPNDAAKCPPPYFTPERNSIAQTWRLCGDEKWKLVLAGTLYFLPGWFLGAWIFGTLGDRLGRRRALILSLSGGVASYAATAVAPTFAMYAVARTLVGCCFGGAAIVAFTLGCELVSMEWVSIIGAGYFNALFILGEMILVIVANYIRGSWRLLIFISLAQGAVLLPLVYLYVPESPRWLQNQGRFADARAVLRRLSPRAKGLMPQPDSDGVRRVLSSSSMGSDAGAAASEMPVGGAAAADRKAGGMFQLCMHPKLFLFTAIMGFMWCTVGAVYYGLTFLAGELPGDRYVNAMLLALVEYPGTLLGNVVIDIRSLGRKYSITMLYAASAAACLFGVMSDGMMRNVVSFVGKCTTTAAFCGVYVYAAELFPTPARNAGLGICSQVARIGSGAATGLLLVIPSPLSMVIFASMSAASALMCGTLLVETFGRPLPDTVEEAVSAKRKIALPTHWRVNAIGGASSASARDDEPLMTGR